MLTQAHNKAHVVFDEQNRDVEFIPHKTDGLHQFGSLIGVHASRRLVEQQQLRTGRQRAGNFKPALLAIRQSRRQLVLYIVKADDFQQLQRLFALVEEVMRVVDSDSLFYDNSGGGVTFGGGEPTAAGAFLLGLLDASIRRGYHICLDTCGVCEPERFRKIMNQVELFLFDCKHMDPDEHKRLTGLDNVLILQNLHTLFEAKKALHIRVPLMPGINDTEKNIAQMAAFLHKHGHNEVDVLPCHTFGHSKYAALNLADPVMVPYQPEELAAALERFAKYDLKVTIV